MRREYEKIEGIVHELLSNALDASSSEININISKNSEETIITIKDNGCGMDEKTLEIVKKILNQTRRDELEDYYGGLVGKSHSASGLSIVGLLIDGSEITSNTTSGTSIKIIRKNNL